MNNQVKLIDETKLLGRLKKELEFCTKEKFNKKNTRFYLGRETVLTDIIRQIESGDYYYVPDTPPVPTIKPGNKVRITDAMDRRYIGMESTVERVSKYSPINVKLKDIAGDWPLSSLEVVE